MATTLVESAAALAPDVRAALRDLILVLADSKRLLGFRYGAWILGAPELETGIACASMAQDEWGHARLMYALLKDFGEDVDRLEHARAPHEYRSMEVLDREPDDWAGVVALNALADSALTVQLGTFRDSAYLPLRQRAEKLLAEEQYHRAHGMAWARRYGGASPEAQQRFADVALAMLPPLLAWFGPQDGRGALLANAGICDSFPDGLREFFLVVCSPVIEAISRVRPEGWMSLLDFDSFDEARRRRAGAGEGPDAETITRVRGDRNRDFLLE
jgi:phenylacetate-CoA oxygenase PaaI subunit